MNLKRIFSVVGTAFLVFLIVGTVAYFSLDREDTNLLKKGHSFESMNKINQYPKGHQCATQCTAQKGFNCGRISQACCETEASCVTTWGMKKCENKKKFDCVLV